MIGQRLPATAELAIFAIVIAILLGVPLGVWAGAKPNSWADNFGSFFGFFGISMPNFWFGIMMILIVSGYFHLLPSAGRNTYGIPGESITGFYIFDSMITGFHERFNPQGVKNRDAKPFLDPSFVQKPQSA